MRAARGVTLLILSGALLLGASVLSQGFLSTDEYAEWSEAQQAALALVLAEAEAQDFLAAYPDWTAYSYLEEGLWVVGFYQGDEWLGDARVDLEADEVIYLYLPRELSPEAYAIGREAIAQVVLADAEVLALLVQPLEWDYDIHYNKYDDKWTMVMWRGLESLAVQLWQEEERFIIEDI
jgi:hypothetical protein